MIAANAPVNFSRTFVVNVEEGTFTHILDQCKTEVITSKVAVMLARARITTLAHLKLSDRKTCSAISRPASLSGVQDEELQARRRQAVVYRLRNGLLDAMPRKSAKQPRSEADSCEN